MILFIDGFDHYAGSGLNKWVTFGVGVSINSSSGRRSGGCLLLSGSNRFVDKALLASRAALVIGFAYDCAGGSNASLLLFQDGSSTHCGVHIGANYELIAFRGTISTVLGSSAPGAVPASGFFYVECKASIHDTAGSVEVRVNGVTVLSLAGVDTRNAGNPYCTGYRIRGIGSPSKVDDHYVCDTSGPVNNDFLGDVRVDTLLPSGDGAYAQFTPSSGSDHYMLVDGATPNTTDYNSGGAVGDRDSYRFPALEALSSQVIHGVQVNVAAMKDDAGLRSIAPFVRSGGANADGASVALSTSQTIASAVFETKPDGGAWTEGAINASEFGVVVTA